MAKKETKVKKAPVKEKAVKKSVAKKETVSLEKLLESGAHFGHQAKRWNPKMAEYLYGQEDGVSVFDLVKTKENLELALSALIDAKKAGLSILLVGTKKQVQLKVKEIAESTGILYINQRFLGGTFTNFDQIKKSIRKLATLKDDMKNGVYAAYTKKEKLLLAREIEDLEKKFAGIAKMEKLPDMVIIIDTHRENGAVMESRNMKIKTVGLVDSNADPNLIDYPIPMNDDAVKALDYVLDLMKAALS